MLRVPMFARRIAVAVICSAHFVCAWCEVFAQTRVPPPATPAVSFVAPPFGSWGVDLAGMNRNVAPGDDFYAFVNGTWDATHTIADDRATLSYPLMNRDRNLARLDAIVRDWIAGRGSHPDALKAAALYRSYVDTASVERASQARVRSYLQEVLAAATKTDLANVMGRSIGRGDSGTSGASLVMAFVADDPDQPSERRLYVYPANLSAAQAEEYGQEGGRVKLEALREYMERLLTVAGLPDASRAAVDALAFERTLASHYPTREQFRDPAFAIPSSWTVLEDQAPGFPWRAWCGGAGICDAPRISVGGIAAAREIANAFDSAPTGTVRAWMLFRQLNEIAGYLGIEPASAQAAFEKVAWGRAPMDDSREQRATALVASALPDALGREFAARHFDEQDRKGILQMAESIRAAVRDRVSRAAWLSSATRAEALRKVNAIRVQVGAPEDFAGYEGLDIRDDDLVGNMERIGLHAWERDKVSLRRPATRRWPMPVHAAIAQYIPTRNEFYIPAGIVQPPIYDADANPAVNFGALGTIIGHEMMHALDDLGRQFDADGRLRDWWSAEDTRQFQARATALAAQYDEYVFPAAPDLRLDGRLGLGEHIANGGGVEVALDAYERAHPGDTSKLLDGFSGVQRFFLGFAQRHRWKYRDQSLRLQVKSGAVPGFLGAYAPLRNVDRWYRAFEIVSGRRLYLAPEERVRIW